MDGAVLVVGRWMRRWFRLACLCSDSVNLLAQSRLNQRLGLQGGLEGRPDAGRLVNQQ